MTPYLADASILDLPTVDTPPPGSRASSLLESPSAGHAAGNLGTSEPDAAPVMWSFEVDGSYLAAVKLRRRLSPVRAGARQSRAIIQGRTRALPVVRVALYTLESGGCQSVPSK